MRFSDSQLHEIKIRTDLVKLVEPSVKLKKAGKEFVGLCPFHEEKSGSFHVNQEKGLFLCRGCGEKGNAIHWLMKHDGMRFQDAVIKLAKDAGIELVDLDKDKNKRASQQAEDPIKKLDKMVLTLAARYFASHTGEPAFQEFVKQRDLAGSEALTAFSLGYAPNNGNLHEWLCKQVPTLKPGILLKALIRTGLYRQKEGSQECYPFFRHRIMFPVSDRTGQIVGFGGRALASWQKAKYMNTAETDYFKKNKILYGLQQARSSIYSKQKVYVVEGYMDVVKMNDHDLPNAIAAMGTAFGETHWKTLLWNMPQNGEAVFCFDGDWAGQKAAFRALDAMLPLITDQSKVSFMFMPAGQDPDSYLSEYGRESFEALTAEPFSATWMKKFKLQDGSSVEERVAIVREALTDLSQMKSAPILASILEGELRKKLGIEPQAWQAIKASADNQSAPAHNSYQQGHTSRHSALTTAVLATTKDDDEESEPADPMLAVHDHGAEGQDIPFRPSVGDTDTVSREAIVTNADLQHPIHARVSEILADVVRWPETTMELPPVPESFAKHWINLPNEYGLTGFKAVLALRIAASRQLADQGEINLNTLPEYGFPEEWVPLLDEDRYDLNQTTETNSLPVYLASLRILSKHLSPLPKEWVTWGQKLRDGERPEEWVTMRATSNSCPF